MLTGRDLQAINFVDDIRIARCSTICNVIYHNRTVAQRRLTAIVEARKLHRVRLGAEYAYYRTQPKQFDHALVRSDFVGMLAARAKIEHYKTGPDFGIKPDAHIIYVLNGKRHEALLEVQLNGKPDIEKYLTWRYKDYFDAMPEIMVVCDMPFDKCGLPIARFGTDLRFKD